MLLSEGFSHSFLFVVKILSIAIEAFKDKLIGIKHTIIQLFIVIILFYCQHLFHLTILGKPLRTVSLV